MLYLNYSVLLDPLGVLQDLLKKNTKLSPGKRLLTLDKILAYFDFFYLQGNDQRFAKISGQTLIDRRTWLQSVLK